MVALSGGPDSVATVLVLEALREQLGFDLLAAHFDHQLRPDSGIDREWARDFCATRNIPFFSGEGDVHRAAADGHQGIEAAARTMRYQFLGFVAGKERVERIATGHTADDQAETILQRILRGSGVRGIRGMLPLAPLPGSPGLTVIHPLLRVSHLDTVAICAEAGITPRIDSTNADSAYTRNRIRNEVLPALRAIAPAIDRALIGLGESAREAFGPLEKDSMTVQPTSREAAGALFALKPLAALQSEAVALVIEREATFFKLPAEVNRTRLQNLRAVLRRGSGQVTFGPIVAEASCGIVRLGPRIHAGEVSAPESKILDIPGATKLGAWRVTVSPSPLPEQASAWTGTIASSRAKGVLRLRTALPGDMVRTAAHHKKLSEWLIDRKIPAWDRLSLVIVADAEVVHAVLGLPAISPPPPDDDALYLRATRT